MVEANVNVPILNWKENADLELMGRPRKESERLGRDNKDEKNAVSHWMLTYIKVRYIATFCQLFHVGNAQVIRFCIASSEVVHFQISPSDKSAETYAFGPSSKMWIFRRSKKSRIAV
jgi:hypothetical protein